MMFDVVGTPLGAKELQCQADRENVSRSKPLVWSFHAPRHVSAVQHLLLETSVAAKGRCFINIARLGILVEFSPERHR